MATKITWLHLSTGIPLSLLIAFTYQLIPIGLLLDMTIHILLLIGNRPSHIVLMKSAPAVIPPYWDLVLLFHLFFYLFFHLMSVYYRNVIWVKSETPSNVAWAYPASGWMIRYSVMENLRIVGTYLKTWGLDLKTRLEDILDG